ncbi:DUF4010 domain-containing protein [Mesorhizobium sp. M0954]|uniref:DUF4010 domain-containing protein n=1 Tax=Mesorhizobium sp. M0954 TaxID=2957032 RepID=UPI00333CC271
MASISFAGYVAVRVLGTTRGLLVSSLAGAIVSSTAVTMALAGGNGFGAARLRRGADRRAKRFGRDGIPAIAAALSFAALGALLLTRDSGDHEGGAIARNPFELGPLLLFALLFAIVATASAALAAQFGGRGLLASSALAGTFDVDVSVLNALRLVKHSVAVETGGQAVLAALAANAIGRLSLAVFAGPMRFLVAAGRCNPDRRNSRLRCGVAATDLSIAPRTGLF